MHKQIYKLEKISKKESLLSLVGKQILILKEIKTILKSVSFLNCLQIFGNFFLNLLEIFPNLWKFITTSFIKFFIRLITITMHFVQIRLCRFVNQKW